MSKTATSSVRYDGELYFTLFKNARSHCSLLGHEELKYNLHASAWGLFSTLDGPRSISGFRREYRSVEEQVVLAVLLESIHSFSRTYFLAEMPYLSILNGGSSERVCREISAALPYHGLQGRGNGK